jgi:hypothetical protein
LGVVGALIEIEYMRLIQEKYNPCLRYYHLGELNINCSKVNYKLNYGPGRLVLCPVTKEWIKYEDVEKKIKEIGEMSVREKELAYPEGIVLASKGEKPWYLVLDKDCEEYVFD